MTNTYRGRFAPSPSGPLHFGSLLAALASYLDAKKHQGQWLLRIEDIDPPREIPGASSLILNTLEDHGLYWDEKELYQSTRSEAYRVTLNELIESAKAYACNCTRKDVAGMGGIYNRHCHQKTLACKGNAIRLRNSMYSDHFSDLILGLTTLEQNRAQEDFIIHRRDGLFAYQLAVVIDDHYQNINHVIRGSDLLDTTCWQLSLFNSLNQPQPKYGHIPLALGENGRKLSKQNKAPALNSKTANKNLHEALTFLGQKPPQHLKQESVNDIINWAISNWNRQQLSDKPQIT